jgi:preprotein translocase subunit YajC
VEGLPGLVVLVLMFGVFYVVLIRPQKRRAQAHQALVESLDVGDEVITIGGMFGTIKQIGDEKLELEIAPGTTLNLLKSAVARRVGEDLGGETTATQEEGA